jgi:hypothetical protein
MKNLNRKIVADKNINDVSIVQELLLRYKKLCITLFEDYDVSIVQELILHYKKPFITLLRDHKYPEKKLERVFKRCGNDLQKYHFLKSIFVNNLYYSVNYWAIQKIKTCSAPYQKALWPLTRNIVYSALMDSPNKCEPTNKFVSLLAEIPAQQRNEVIEKAFLGDPGLQPDQIKGFSTLIKTIESVYGKLPVGYSFEIYVPLWKYYLEDNKIGIPRFAAREYLSKEVWNKLLQAAFLEAYISKLDRTELLSIVKDNLYNSRIVLGIIKALIDRNDQEAINEIVNIVNRKGYPFRTNAFLALIPALSKVQYDNTLNAVLKEEHFDELISSLNAVISSPHFDQGYHDVFLYELCRIQSGHMVPGCGLEVNCNKAAAALLGSSYCSPQDAVALLVKYNIPVPKYKKVIDQKEDIVEGTRALSHPNDPVYIKYQEEISHQEFVGNEYPYLDGYVQVLRKKDKEFIKELKGLLKEQHLKLYEDKNFLIF